ncbi:MAG: HPr family phosphocarrier protein [Lentisphaerae bacterium]|nr:HPr family phosphocarrier protein [Lentisphaerota bacterium]
MEPSTLKTRDVLVRNQYGIHARPAALFVKLASRFDADLMVEKDGTEVSGKSIMGLMTLQASCGSKLCLKASGADADQMLDALQKLFDSKFEEE